jgi:hypothetical protein
VSGVLSCGGLVLAIHTEKMVATGAMNCTSTWLGLILVGAQFYSAQQATAMENHIEHRKVKTV